MDDLSDDSYDIDMNSYIPAAVTVTRESDTIKAEDTRSSNAENQAKFGEQRAKVIYKEETTKSEKCERNSEKNKIIESSVKALPSEGDVAVQASAQWDRYLDAISGAYYMYNSVTGETKWEEVIAGSNDSIDKGWQPYYDHEGNQYYFNQMTGEYAWSLPSQTAQSNASNIKLLSPKDILSSPLKGAIKSLFSDSSINIDIHNETSIDGSSSLQDSSFAEMSILQSRIDSLGHKLNQIQTPLEASNADRDSAETSIEIVQSILSSSIAIEWRWPWSALFDTHRRKIFYLHEVSSTLQTDRPRVFEASDPHYATSSSVEANTYRMQQELLYRMISQRNIPLEAADAVSPYALSSKLSSKMAFLVMPKPTRRVSHRAMDLMQELLDINQSFLIDQMRNSHQQSFNKANTALNHNMLTELRSKPLGWGRLRPVSSPTCRSSSPLKRPLSASLRAQLSTPLDDAISPIPRAQQCSALKNLIIKTYCSMDKAENEFLREKIYEKHFMVAATRQRNLLEGLILTNAVYDEPEKTADVKENSIHTKTANVKASLREKCLSGLSSTQYIRYRDCIEAVSAAPSDAEAMLILIELLFSLDQPTQAMIHLENLKCNSQQYNLSSIDSSFIYLLNFIGSCKYRNVFSDVASIKEIGVHFYGDSTILSLIAIGLKVQKYSVDAENYFVASLVRDPSNFIALRGYSEILVAKEDYLGAIKCLNRLSTMNECSFTDIAKLEVAWCSELAGQSDTISLQYYGSVLHHSCPKHIQSFAYSSIGYIHVNSKDSVVADSHFIKSISLNYENAHALILFCFMRQSNMTDRLNKCNRYLTTALDILKRSKSRCLWIAELAYGDFLAYTMRDFTLAELAYRRSISNGAGSHALRAYVQLIAHANSIDQVNSKLSWVSTLIDKNCNAKSAANIKLAIALTFIKVGLHDRAGAILSDVSSTIQNSSEFFRCRAYLSLLTNNSDAKDYFEESLNCEDCSQYTLRSAAAYYASVCNWTSALDLISEANIKDDSNPHALAMQAILVYITVGDTAICIDLLKRACRLSFNLEIIKILGQMLFELGNYEDALFVLLPAADKHPKDCITLVTIILCYDAIRKKQIPVNCEQQESETTYQVLIGGLLARLQNEINKYHALQTTFVPPEVYYRLGVFYLNLSNRNDNSATNTARQMLIRGGMSLHSLCVFMLGWTYELEGNIDFAEELYKFSIQLQPNDIVLQRKLRLLSSTTLRYVESLVHNAKTKLPKLNRRKKVWVRKTKGCKNGIVNLTRRLMVHQRISKTLHLSASFETEVTQLKPFGRVYIHPLWSTNYLGIFSNGESWVLSHTNC